MHILRIRNHNNMSAKVKWSSAAHETVEHTLKVEYRTTLFLIADQLETVSVPYGTAVEMTCDGENWKVLQGASPQGELPSDEGV